MQMFKNAKWKTVEACEVIYSFDRNVFQLNFLMEGLVNIESSQGFYFTIGRWGYGNVRAGGGWLALSNFDWIN